MWKLHWAAIDISDIRCSKHYRYLLLQLPILIYAHTHNSHIQGGVSAYAKLNSYMLRLYCVVAMLKYSHKTAASKSMDNLTKCSCFSHVRRPFAFAAAADAPLSTVMAGILVLLLWLSRKMPVRLLGWTFLIGMLELNYTQFHSRLCCTQLNTPRLCTSHVLSFFFCAFLQSKLKNQN